MKSGKIEPSGVDTMQSKAILHSPAPLKLQYFNITKELDIRKLRVRNYRWTHLQSHPIHKIGSKAARYIAKIRSLKLLSLSDYGYKIIYFDDDDYDDEKQEEEEMVIRPTIKQGFEDGDSYFGITKRINKFQGEDVYRGELNPILSKCAHLRKLKIMLRSATFQTFERLFRFALKQKELKELGIHAGKFQYFPNKYLNKGVVIKKLRRYNEPLLIYDLTPLRNTLKKLTIRYEERDDVSVTGIDKLKNLWNFRIDTPCGEFPVSEGDSHGEIPGNPIFSTSSHINLIKEALNAPNLSVLHLLSHFLMYEEKFWGQLAKVLSDHDRKLTLKIYSLTYLSEKCDKSGVNLGKIKECLSKLSEDKVQIILRLWENDYWVAESTYQWGTLTGQKFNIDEHYIEDLDDKIFNKGFANICWDHPELAPGCPECRVARAEDGYKCPPKVKHLECEGCNQFFADRRSTHPQTCSLCNTPYCSLYLPNSACAGKLQRFGQPDPSFRATFRKIAFEQEIWKDYLTRKNLTDAQVVQQYLENHNPFEYTRSVRFFARHQKRTEIYNVKVNDPVCHNCLTDLYDQVTFRIRESFNSELPKEVADRTNCLQGYNCVVASHDYNHGKMLNHICEQTKF